MVPERGEAAKVRMGVIADMLNSGMSPPADGGAVRLPLGFPRGAPSQGAGCARSMAGRRNQGSFLADAAHAAH